MPSLHSVLTLFHVDTLLTQEAGSQQETVRNKLKKMKRVHRDKGEKIFVRPSEEETNKIVTNNNVCDIIHFYLIIVYVWVWVYE